MAFGFTYNEDQIALQKTVRKFVENEIVPVRASYDESEEFPWPEVKKMFELGLNCMNAPEKFNGMVFGNVGLCMVVEELCRGCLGIAISPIANMLASEPVLYGGTEEQWDYWYPSICEEGKLAAYAVTEPGAGSDVAGLSTTCKKDGDYYILNGTKIFITNGKHADKLTVLATHDKSKGNRAQSFFMVDTKTEGVSFGKSEHKMGMRCSETSEVILDNVKVHKKYRLGEEGDGFKLAMKAFNSSRPFIASASTGVASAAFEFARDYAKERKAFGKSIADFQAIQFMLADMAMDIEASKLLWQKAAWLLDEKLMAADLSAMSKCFAADAANRVVTNAVQILGGYGFCREYPVEKMMRDAKILQIFEGTAQIQRVIIGKSVLA
ncbi:acyl-CoA dehydrogenase family protein [Syntrophomonas wolfei]|jgi:alkylation response protein AidB-like acyl-CoA dehydrogenase|uniref:acyl-CoA dehydrogenase family protein n=3 Tax=Syntrophomonas wolfei TaxID=863 RepID=UPI000772EB96|nr:acyl-CoA dehydrogenase family protein [Syntrophomonas wolfei]